MKRPEETDEARDDASFERFVRDETGAAPVSRGELRELREEYDERHRYGDGDQCE